MKLIVIIGNPNEPFTYFANTINSKHKIDLLIIEKKIPAATIHTSKKKSPELIEKTLNYFLFKIEQRKKRKKEKQEKIDYFESCKKWFGNLHLSIDIDIPTLEVTDINSKEVKRRILEINPELILVHGSSLLKSEIISLAKLTLNLHWGLSPYYRGVNCTMRALINWDIKNIGVTIHKLATQIDGGDILGQARAKISTISELKFVTLQLTYLGTAIIIRAVDRYKEGKELPFKKQDFTKGFLFKGLHWDQNIFNFSENIDETILNKMLAHPSRHEVPIIELN